ncbi:MAG: translocation/assembly module TamB domain-containing protein, partial [Pseudobdellovibrio sp.]
MKTKRISLIATPFIVLGLVALLWIQIIKPKVIEFITVQVPKINSAQSAVVVAVEKIDISILKLQLNAYGLKVEFKEPLLETLSVSTVSGQLDIFDLIIGRVNLSKLIIESATWTYEVKKNNDTPNPEKIKIPTEEIFKYLKMIPIHRIVIYDSNVKVKSNNPLALINIQIPQLTLANKKNELAVSASNVNLEFTENQKDSANCETDFILELSPTDLRLNNLEVRALGSSLELSGVLKNLENILEPQGRLKFNSQINLEDIRTLGLSLFPQKTRIPSISGSISSNADVEFASLSDIKGNASITSSKVTIDHFKLGQAKINASIRKNQIELTEIELQHPSGDISLKNVKINQKSPHAFTSKIDIESFDLQKLFLSLGQNDIPAGLQASGIANCEGVLRPAPSVNCNVDSDIKDVWVKSDIKESFHILKLKKGHIQGDVKLTKDGMNYKSQLTIGSSKGSSEGSVDFKEGFNLNYETEKLDFNDVESLADLNIKGVLKIKGTTSGDSSRGVINATIAMTDAEIDGFRVGNFTSDLEYKNTQLRFNNLNATIGKSELAGLLHFNFNESILSADFKSKLIHGEDILNIINKKFNIPFALTGTGKAEVQLSGPFDFWKLNYSLKAELNKGSIAEEQFEHLDLNLESDGQTINFKNVKLKKTKSVVTVEGGIITSSTEPVFNLKIKANPFLLEETDHIIAYAPAIAGVGYAEGQVKGTTAKPELAANFTLKQVSYDKVDYPNSQGNLTIDKDYFNFRGQFFGRQIQMDVAWPWNEKNNFSAKVLIHDLNPLFLLPLISIPQPSSDFYSRLNAEVDLSSKTRNISEAEGYIRITDFSLQRSTQFLKLQKPSSIIFKNGLSQMEPLNLKGDETYLNIKMTSNNYNNLRFNVDADLQLRMFHFLVPFAQAIAGNLVIDSQVLIKENSFELFGEGELTDGLVSLKGFPQSIDNINTPIEFSKSKIFLNDITGQLGQSDVTGLGHIDILGSKNIQVNLRAVADNVELNFPDQILTAGKANVLFSGNWLPYTLKIDYKVSHGLVEKNFGGDDGEGQTLKASSFLPPQQIEQLSPSLALDVNVDLTRGIIIKNQLLEGEATGLLNISGSPESPIIKGKIDITRGSKLIFKDKAFDIQTASINFTQSKEINPMVYASANSRISDYDINLLVQGPSKNLSIKPTSQPPLAENEIFSLIAFGVTSQTDQNLSSETQQKQTGLEVLAAISNQSQINKKIQEKFGLTVQLAPSVDSTKNIAVPKVVVSKKITNKINASYSKPFTGNDQNQELKVQYLYNKNMSLLFNYQNKDNVQQDQIN